MNLEVPLYNKAIAYIENIEEVDIESEITKKNSSIILFYVLNQLQSLEEKYEDNERYHKVINLINSQLEVITPDWISSYDESKRRFVKKKFKK